MENAIVQIAVQVPAMAIMAYVCLKVLTMVMDVQGRKIERLVDAVEKAVEKLR